MTAWSCLLAALAFGVAACGDDDEGGDTKSGGGGGGGKTLTIYSSLPLVGTDLDQNTDVVRGEQMALAEVGNKVGNFKIKFQSLNDGTASAGKWDPGQVSSNARKAVTDKSAIAYIGEFNSGGSAVSIPLTNEGNLLQVSPSNTYCGLTKEGCGEKDEPQKYYPSGTRTYGRVVPQDAIQAAAQATYQKENGCTKLYIVNDKEVYGKGVADGVEDSAKKLGIQILGNDGIDPKAANYRSLAAKIKSAGADCFFFGGITANHGVAVFKDVFAANPGIKMFGPDGVTEEAFASKLGSRLEKVVFLTVPTLDPKSYPPEAQKFFTDFKAKYGEEPNPYGIYGYEAMSAVLTALKAAGDQAGDRQAVIEAFFNIKGKKSVLGTYDIDKNGDTTLSDYGSYRVKDGKITFDRVIKAQTQ